MQKPGTGSDSPTRARARRLTNLAAVAANATGTRPLSDLEALGMIAAMLVLGLASFASPFAIAVTAFLMPTGEKWIMRHAVATTVFWCCVCVWTAAGVLSATGRPPIRFALLLLSALPLVVPYVVVRDARRRRWLLQHGAPTSGEVLYLVINARPRALHGSTRPALISWMVSALSRPFAGRGGVRLKYAFRAVDGVRRESLSPLVTFARAEDLRRRGTVTVCYDPHHPEQHAADVFMVREHLLAAPDDAP